MIQTNGPLNKPPNRVLLVSIPRTASNLLVKVLNLPNQSNVHSNEKAGYFFYPGFVTAARGGYMEKPAEQWTNQEKEQVRATYQGCLDKIEECTSEAEEKNKMMFAKEHSFWMHPPASFQKKITGVHNEEFFNTFRVNTPEKYGSTRTYSPLNETIFSDEYLRSWQMIFIIRHPALTWPSFWRSMLKFSKEGIIDEDEVQGGTTMANMSMRWSRSLYDWNLHQDRRHAPPILDAYDLIHSPEVVIKFCEQAGMNSTALQFEWNCQADDSDHWASAQKVKEVATKTGVDERHIRASHIMLNTLSHSSGLLKDKTPEEVDISTEMVKWKAEFGDEVAGKIKKAVWDSMPDYEYMKARRVTV
ncbi:hypothetical protein N7456_002461 [Penicillium angulare]|uniref:Sulfotransferase domain-containing protein n=1 Tax=Penicillium angulare TaxID=116970 RepID=A0A9W9KQ82_9EURO|nr:hypothetical protein N7456_002461 [Penicillium angulare]